MTKAKAATVASALITAGYQVQVVPVGTDSYSVTAQVVGGSPVDAGTVNTFAGAQSVTSQIDSVRFI